MKFSEDGTPVPTFSSNQDVVVFKLMEEIARARCNEGLTTVIDAMNLTDIARKQFISLGNWKKVITIVFDPEKAVARNAARARRVSDSQMQEKISKFEMTSEIPGNTVVHVDWIYQILHDYPYIHVEQ